MRVLDRVLHRLEVGRERYGLLDLSKPRDWRRERFEERLDALVYDACEELAIEDQHRAELRAAARAEMLSQPPRHEHPGYSGAPDVGPPRDICDLAIEIAQRGSKTLPVPLRQRTPAGRADYIIGAVQAGVIMPDVAREMLKASTELREWQADQHRTRASAVPAKLAAADMDELEPYAGFEIGGEGG